MLTFAHIWVFWLVVLPVLVVLGLPAKAQSRPAVRIPFLPRLLASKHGDALEASRSVQSWIVPTIVWLLLIVALARPQWLEPPIERVLPTRDLLLLVDLSASMDHADFTNSAGKPVNRLTAVKEVVGDFLIRRQGDRVGLVVFGNAPFLQVPFTADLELCRQLLDEVAVGMAGPRTALGDAIGLGIQLFETSDVPTKTIIALTDGNDTASAVPPVEASRIARDRDITIHTIAVGDPTTVGEEAIDQTALQEVAEATGGKFFLALNREELSQIYADLDKIETRQVTTVSHSPRHDLFFWPLGLGLVVSLLASGLKLWTARRVSALAPKTRLRVNARTFELETVDR